MSQKAKFPPDSSEVLTDLKPFLSNYVEQALLYGIDRAHQYFESAPGQGDPWLFSHLVRFNFKQWLKVNDLANVGFEIHEIAMSGLWLKSPKYEVRIWKEDWRPDPETRELVARIQPGNSGARHEYFTQPRLELEFEAVQVLRLVINWALDENLRLGTFDLACPSEFSREDNNVTTHWWLSIPRLDTSISAAAPIDAPGAPPELLPDIDLSMGRRADDDELDADSR